MILKRAASKEDSTLKLDNEKDPEMAMLFEIPNGDEEARGGGENLLLIDEDYNESNRTYNRVKSYSFARI